MNIAKVRREMADHLEGRLEPSYTTLARWLLALTPNRRIRRPKDQARAARRVTEKQLDALCREVVFLRDKGRCRKCGKVAVDWSHCYSRRYKWLRWDLDNSWASCKKCHLDWHHRPLEGAKWWKGELYKLSMGTDRRYNSLVLRAGKPRKVDLALVLAYLENRKVDAVAGREIE